MGVAVDEIEVDIAAQLAGSLQGAVPLEKFLRIRSDYFLAFNI